MAASSVERSQPSDQDAILDAACGGDLGRVRSLIDANPSLATAPRRKERYEGATALMLASYGGFEAIVKLLLERGAAVNPVGQDGSALLMAAFAGHAGVVELLLKHGADPNVTSASGETSLMAAALKGHIAIGTLLINRGADVNAQTREGTTDLFATSPPVCGESALHLAAGYGHRGFVELLLERGALKTVTDRGGQRPLHWAARLGRMDLLSLLKQDASVTTSVPDRGK
jgi:uncharacterized protein